MNIKIALEWMKASYTDLVLIQEIIENDFLTHMVAFHSQQSLEKAFKALIEFNNKAVPKKHDLLLLNNLIKEYIEVGNEEILEDLNELYIDSRYPGNLGLLPYGKPTLKDAKEFFEFTQETFYRVCKVLNIDIDELKV